MIEKNGLQNGRFFQETYKHWVPQEKVIYAEKKQTVSLRLISSFKKTILMAGLNQKQTTLQPLVKSHRITKVKIINFKHTRSSDVNYTDKMFQHFYFSNYTCAQNVTHFINYFRVTMVLQVLNPIVSRKTPVYNIPRKLTSFTIYL